MVFGVGLTLDVSDEAKYNTGSWTDISWYKLHGITEDGGMLEWWDIPRHGGVHRPVQASGRVSGRPGHPRHRPRPSGSRRLHPHQGGLCSSILFNKRFG